MNHCIMLYVLDGEVNIVINYDMPDESDSYLHLDEIQLNICTESSYVVIVYDVWVNHDVKSRRDGKPQM